MAFPTGWSRRVPVVVQSSLVAATESNFPVLLTEANLPSEMFDADGADPAQADGGDIRISTDSNGENLLPIEVVLFSTDNNPALGKAEIWVPVNVSTSADTTIYVWYSGPGGQVQPDKLAVGGSGDAWERNFFGVFHWSSSVDVVDSTKAGLDNTFSRFPSVGNSWTLADGKIGKCMSHPNTSTNHHLRASFGNFFKAWDKFAFEVWVNPLAVAANDTVLGLDFSNGIRFETNGNLSLRVGGTFFGTAAITTGSWFHVVFVFDLVAGTVTPYINGSVATSESGVTILYGLTALPFAIGSVSDTSANRTFRGLIDEFRMHGGTVRSANYWLTSYRAQNSPATFAVVGSPATPTFTADVELTGLVSGSEVRAYVGTPSSSTLLDSTESSGTSFTFTHSESGNAGFIVVRKLDKKYMKIDLTYAATDVSIPVSQQDDAVYANP